MQSSYSNYLDKGQVGQIADTGPRRVESYVNIDKSIIDFGRAVAQGDDAELNVRNFYNEVQTVVYSGDFVTSNSISFDVNGLSITPVVFTSTSAATMTALIAAVDALSGVSAVAGGDAKTIVVTREVLKAEDSEDCSVTTLVTLGAGQVTATSTGSTIQSLSGVSVMKQNEDGDIAQYYDLGVMTQGVIWGELVTGQTPAVGGSVYYVNGGDDRGKFTTVNDATTEIVAGARFKSTVETMNGKVSAKIEINQP